MEGELGVYVGRMSVSGLPHTYVKYSECVCISVTVFAKRDHLGANLDFEFCI